MIADADTLKCRIWRDGQVHMRQKSLKASAGHKVSVCERPCGKWTQCVPRLYRAGFRGRLALLLQEVTQEFTSIHLAIDWPQILIAPSNKSTCSFHSGTFLQLTFTYVCRPYRIYLEHQFVEAKRILFSCT